MAIAARSSHPVVFAFGAVVALLLTVTGRARAADRCPSEMALAGGSCVDKWEASLVEVHEDGSESPFSPYEAPNGHRVRAVSRPDVVPQAHMSMVEAKRACSASGKRLCRAAEWKTACRGPENTTFPYGNERLANACVDTNRTSPVNKLHNGEHSSRTMNDPLLNQQPNTLATTGEAAACTNGYGVHDMVGNIHEWTDDGSFRGGYYLDTEQNGDGCEYRTTAHSPIYYDYSTGFRCCADPDSLSDDASEPSGGVENRGGDVAPRPPSTLGPEARGSEPSGLIVTVTEQRTIAADPSFETPERRTASRGRVLPRRAPRAAAVMAMFALAPRSSSSSKDRHGKSAPHIRT